MDSDRSIRMQEGRYPLIRDIVILSFRDNGMTISQIARACNLSRERVRQLLVRAEREKAREDKSSANWIVRNGLFK